MKFVVKNIFLKNSTIEFLTNDTSSICLFILRKFFILLVSPLYILKINRITDFRLSGLHKNLRSNQIRKKILLRITLENKKKITSKFSFKFYFQKFKVEIITGKNFLLTLKEPRVGDFLTGPYNFLITSATGFSGFESLKGSEYDIVCGIGFGKLNFYLTRLFPTYIRKEIIVLKGIKFVNYLSIHPLLLSLISIDTGFKLWFFMEHKNFFSFMQIFNLNVFKKEKIKFFFNNLECSFYFGITNLSILSTFRVLFTERRYFLRFESLGKIEDSLIFSLTDICWKQGVFPKLLGGFRDGKILIWNEILLPIIQFSNHCFSIANLTFEEKSYNYIFILKKNKIVKKDTGKKIFLKTFPQSILCELNSSKYKKTISYKKDWFLLNWKFVQLQYFSSMSHFSCSNPSSTNNLFFILNRDILSWVEKIHNEIPIQNSVPEKKKAVNFTTNIKIFKFCNLEKKIAKKAYYVLFMIGKKRYLTKQEIYSEQSLIFNGNLPLKNCQICSRSWRNLIEKIEQDYCPFNHTFKELKPEKKGRNLTFCDPPSSYINPPEQNTSFIFEPFFDIHRKNHYNENNFLQKQSDIGSLFSFFYRRYVNNLGVKKE